MRSAAPTQADRSCGWTSAEQCRKRNRQRGTGGKGAPRRDGIPHGCAVQTPVRAMFSSSRRPCGGCSCPVALSLDGAVDGRAAHAEEVGDLGGGVLAAWTRETRWASWRRLSLGCLPRRWPLALATFMPSRVRSRIRSDSIMWTPVSCQGSSGPTDPPDSVLSTARGRPDRCSSGCCLKGLSTGLDTAECDVVAPAR